MNPTWFTTDPTVPPVAGGEPARMCKYTRTPGNLTTSKSPRLTDVPPMATKIFLLASTSRELRCRWPIVTPASFAGNGCAEAAPAIAKHSAIAHYRMRFMVSLPITRHTARREQPDILAEFVPGG